MPRPATPQMASVLYGTICVQWSLGPLECHQNPEMGGNVGTAEVTRRVDGCNSKLKQVTPEPDLCQVSRPCKPRHTAAPIWPCNPVHPQPAYASQCRMQVHTGNCVRTAPRRPVALTDGRVQHGSSHKLAKGRSSVVADILECESAGQPSRGSLNETGSPKPVHARRRCG